MKTISNPGAALLGNRLAQACLIEMQFSSTVYLTTAGIDIEHGGNTYLGGRGVSVEEVEDQGGEVKQLRISMSGVPSESISLALGEELQGRSVRLWTALMDPDTQAIVDVIPLWSGQMDQMPIKHGPEQSVVTVTAEHRGIAFSRPKALRYTDAEQRRLYPGDRCLEFVVSQANHADIWPSAEFFKK